MMQPRFFSARRALPNLALFLTVFSLSATASAQFDPIVTGLEVQETFRAFKTAILEDDGEAATKLVSQGTIEYFATAQDLALYGTPESREKRSLTDRLQITLLRHRVPLSQLRSLSPEGLFAHAVEHGWVTKRSIGPMDVGVVRLEDGAALAKAAVNAQPSELDLRFVFEQKSWKLDLLPMLAVGDEKFSALAEQQQLTGEQLILGILGRVTGSEVSSAIFQPPLSRAE